MPDSPSLASQIAGVLTCFEAIADAIIARDPAMGVAIEERLEEALTSITTRDGPKAPSALPPEGLLYILQMKRRRASSTGAEPPP